MTKNAEGKEQVFLVDTHAHLDFPELRDELDQVLAECHEAGVHRVVTIGIDEETSRKALNYSRSRPEVYATVGLHPHGARELSSEDLNRMQDLARDPRVVAIGEIGLDFYRDRQPRDVQKRCLGQQLDLAVHLKLPAVFHVREAYRAFFEEVLAWKDRLKPSVLHCFSGDWSVARKALDWGFYLSIPGTITFKNAGPLQEVVRKCPMDRLLVETDAPFLTPVPFRGKPNRPAYVRYTAEKIAQLRKCSLEEVARSTTQNAYSVFRLDEKEVLGNACGGA